MPIYRPRMSATMLVPLDAGVASEDRLEIRPRLRSASLTLNDHNHADELEFECAWSDLGIDPRLARNASVDFSMGDQALEFGTYSPPPSDFRFAGVADTVERSAGENGHVAKVKCRDFTALFLGMKPFPPSGVPSMSSTLVAAWEQVCDHTGYRDINTKQITSSVARLRNRLEFRGGVSPDLVIGDAVAPRFKKIGGSIPTKPGADAWAVWQQCIGMLGLVSWIERDRCIVSTSVDQYAEGPEAAPVLVYGRNILEMTETADSTLDSKGVWLTSFDPMTGQTIEAFWPPKGEVPHNGKASTGKTPSGSKGTTGHKTHQQRAAAQDIVDASDYWHQAYPSITNPDVLTARAKSVWEERARQEMSGKLKTAEMRISQESGAETDLLALRCGDSIRVEIDHVDRDVFSILSTVDARAEYLEDLGYNTAAARILARNSRNVLQYGRTFKVKSVRIHLSADGDAGEFSVEVEYLNKIDLAA